MAAPIILFTYTRLDHLKQVIKALKSNEESSKSELFIFSDEGKDEESIRKVHDVRKYLKTVQGFMKVHIIERQTNWGIEKSEIEGITEIIHKYKKAIILEDDIEVGPSFLKFMNSSLKKYENSKEVFSIAGYSHLKNVKSDERVKTGFIKLCSPWGWATWEDRWDLFCSEIKLNDIQILKDKKLRQSFDYGYNYSEMLLVQYMTGYITWDVKWYWTAFINNKLTLTPYCSMVNNIGMDGSGVHYTEKLEDVYVENLEVVNNIDFPAKIEEDKRLKKLVMLQLGKMKKSNISLLESVVYSISYSLRIDYLLYKIESSEFEERGIPNRNCKNVIFKMIQIVKGNRLS